MLIRILQIVMFSLMAGSVIGQAPKSPKPPVGVPTDAKLFNGKWYHVYFDKCSWRTAQDKSARAGGQLAVIPDEATNEFIKQLADGLLLWLGATDEKVEGKWIWVDQSEMKFKSWSRNEPNNSYGREHYLATNQDGNWNDAPEKESKIVGYICEWKTK